MKFEILKYILKKHENSLRQRVQYSASYDFNVTFYVFRDISEG